MARQLDKLITRLHRFLTAKTSKSQIIFWFSLSLTFAIVYSLLDLQQAFSSTYVVQDDARVYVSWMQRFLEPDLLKNDLITDYFQSVTPSGYAALYRLIASVGISPLLLSKILPVFLRLLTTGYCFAVCIQILPIPTAGFITTLLLNQTISMRDDLVSSTPRSFIYLLFLAFLYYLLRRSLLLCLGAIALSGLFYPPLLLIVAGILILRLWRCKGKIPHLSENKFDYVLCATGLALSFLVMLPYASSSSEFGPVIADIEARSLPAFSEKGRIPFFDDNPLLFWIFGQHSGLLPNVLEHPVTLIGLLLPILLRYPYRFPKALHVTSNVTLLPQILLASFGIFLAAHALLYKLFAPARYTRYTFRLVLILAAGIALLLILDAVFRWALQQTKLSDRRQFLALGLTAFLGGVLVFYPYLLKNFPHNNYIVGEAPAVYEFFREQPKDIIIASLSQEADNLPTFSKRAILVGWEYAVPYHVGYDRQIRQRATDLIRAQYTQSLAEVKSFIQTYGVDFFLLDASAFTPEYISTNHWFRQWDPIAKEVLAMLEQGNTPALVSTLERCSFEREGLIVIQAACVASQQ